MGDYPGGRAEWGRGYKECPDEGGSQRLAGENSFELYFCRVIGVRTCLGLVGHEPFTIPPSYSDLPKILQKEMVGLSHSQTGISSYDLFSTILT